MPPEKYHRGSPCFFGLSDKEEQYLSNLQMKDHPKGSFELSPAYERVLAHRIAAKLPKLLQTLTLLQTAKDHAPPKLQAAINTLLCHLDHFGVI